MLQRTEQEITVLLNELKAHAKDWVKDQFDVELTIPILRNNRLSRACGRFTVVHQYRVGQPPLPFANKIDIAGNILKHADEKLIYDVLNHELVHYSLFSKELPYRDSDRFFKETCNELNIPLSIPANSYELPVHHYSCACSEDHTTKRALRHNGKYHSCNFCKSKLTYLGKY